MMEEKELFLDGKLSRENIETIIKKVASDQKWKISKVLTDPTRETKIFKLSKYWGIRGLTIRLPLSKIPKQSQIVNEIKFSYDPSCEKDFSEYRQAVSEEARKYE